MQRFKSFLAACTFTSIVGCCSFPYDPSKYTLLEELLAKTKQVYVTEENFFEKIPTLSYLEVLASVTSPEFVKKYVSEYLVYAADEKTYKKNDYWASFRTIHEKKKDDCDGGAVAAAALLNEDKYQVYILKIQEQKEERAHMVCVYETKEGLFGCISVNTFECILQAKDLNSILSLFANDYDVYKLINVNAYRSALRFGKGHLTFLEKLIEEKEYLSLPDSRIH